MNAGELDRRVSIQNRSLSQDAAGQDIETWATSATVWAKKGDLRGREFFAAQTMNGEITTSFVMRYRTDVTVLSRLLYGGITYNVRQVSEIGRKEGLQIYCTARVP